MAPHKETKPLSDDEITRLMAAVGPFEGDPHIAVAVSGGADSLALTLLADAWVRGHGGKLTALSVDHGLRLQSADETLQVGKWLAARGIEHHVLTWMGDKPRTSLQATARAARYDLLGKWCRREGVLHLLLAHHLEDQAETFLLRLKRGSGIDGLAAMAAIVEKPDMRLLRPLLGVSKARLRASLEAASQPWLEDPSNENTAFERVRIRKTFPELATAGITAQGLSDAARRMARARIALEAAASGLLAESCSLDGAGYARIDGAALFSRAEEISLRALSRTLMCIGGGEYPPRQIKLERLHEKMKAAHLDGIASWKGATLGRCRILGLACEGGKTHFLVCREHRALPAPIPVQPAMECDWDERFRIRLRGQKGVLFQGARLQPLGTKGWNMLLSNASDLGTSSMPAPVRQTLPALIDDEGVIAVPHLNYSRNDKDNTVPGFARVIFHPKQTLSGAGFLVAE